MLEELQRQLREALDREFESVRLSSHFRRVQSSLKKERERLRTLDEKLHEEERDVTRLEGLSLTGLFHAILGGKEEKLEQERQEFLAARLNHEECGASIAALQMERAELESQLQALGDIAGDLRNAYRLKEHALERKGGHAAYLITKLTERTAQTRNRRKELREARAAGQDAVQALVETRDLLKSALNWAGLDFFGGGAIVTAVKLDKMDRANRVAQTAQQHLSRFYRELEDVKRHPDTNLEVKLGEFLTFADYFFDGLIVDWVVHSRIKQSKKRVKEVTERVRQILATLEREHAAVEEDLAEAEHARLDLIEKG